MLLPRLLFVPPCNRLTLESEHGGCEFRSEWQGYHCKGLQHHMLVIESLDADTETRRLSPIALHGEDTGAGVEYTDLINGPMDHGRSRVSVGNGKGHVEINIYTCSIIIVRQNLHSYFISRCMRRRVSGS